jgi:S-adenosylmethionine hydrolase
MPVITLTSDWNSGDYYLAAIKGQLLGINDRLTIVDISHQVKPFNSAQAAFILRNAWPHFPEGSIHLILVNTERTGTLSQLAVKANGHYFIGTDNGIFSQILGGSQEEMVMLKEDAPINSFHGLKSFTKAAAALANGEPLSSLGTPVKAYQERIPIRATIEDKTITGSIIYIDSFQNAITNISRELFERIGNGRKYEIFVQSKHNRITRLSNSYHDQPPGELLALFNSAHLLEIAISNGNAARLLNLDMNSTVKVEFINP